MSDWSERVEIMNDMQIAKLIKKKKRLLVILNDYDTGYNISAVVLSQNFEIIEIVEDEICRQWFDDWNWDKSAIVRYLTKKYGEKCEMIFNIFSDGLFVAFGEYKGSKNADKK